MLQEAKRNARSNEFFSELRGRRIQSAIVVPFMDICERMGLTVPYTGTRGGGGGGGWRREESEKQIVSRTSSNDPCNLCTY